MIGRFVDLEATRTPRESCDMVLDVRVRALTSFRAAVCTSTPMDVELFGVAVKVLFRATADEADIYASIVSILKPVRKLSGIAPIIFSHDTRHADPAVSMHPKCDVYNSSCSERDRKYGAAPNGRSCWSGIGLWRTT